MNRKIFIMVCIFISALLSSCSNEDTERIMNTPLDFGAGFEIRILNKDGTPHNIKKEKGEMYDIYVAILNKGEDMGRCVFSSREEAVDGNSLKFCRHIFPEHILGKDDVARNVRLAVRIISDYAFRSSQFKSIYVDYEDIDYKKIHPRNAFRYKSVKSDDINIVSVDEVAKEEYECEGQKVVMTIKLDRND